MKNPTKNLITAIIATLCCVSAYGQKQKVLSVADIKVSESLVEKSQRNNTYLSLQMVTEALNGLLVNALNATGKFEIKERQNLDVLMKESALSGNAVDLPSLGSDYAVAPKIDDFQDFVERASFGGIGAVVEKRKITLGTTIIITDNKTGSVLTTASFQLDNKDMEDMINSSRNGMESDRLIRQIAETMANTMANRVMDVLNPALILSFRPPSLVTINRGDGTGIAIGQKWEVFAKGEELIDPDTGVSLGFEEFPVGMIEITRVNPATSMGKIVGDDYGIEKGAILRPAL
jgi:curli biogenesis system outer membrane secretion channel CsgG